MHGPTVFLLSHLVDAGLAKSDDVASEREREPLVFNTSFHEGITFSAGNLTWPRSHSSMGLCFSGG